MTAEAATIERRPAVEPAAVSPDIFAHFVLRTANLGPMRAWWQSVLNARIAHDDGRICFLTYDDEHHRLALISMPELKAPEAHGWGLAHVAYGYRTLRQLLSTYRRLKQAGILPYRPINHGPTLSLYYHDPDGNSVEFQVDAFPTKEAAAAYFRTADFKRNPVGVPFDPEALIRAYESGVPEADLLRRP